jgi:hypothetical protein
VIWEPDEVGWHAAPHRRESVPVPRDWEVQLAIEVIRDERSVPVFAAADIAQALLQRKGVKMSLQEVAAELDARVDDGELQRHTLRLPSWEFFEGDAGTFVGSDTPGPTVDVYLYP